MKTPLLKIRRYRFNLAAAALLFGLLCNSLDAQVTFEVLEFRLDPLNLKPEVSPLLDMNADKCALLRIESDLDGELYFTQVKVYKRDKNEPGMFDFYISFRERNITLTSPGFMPYTYRIPQELKPGRAYVMRVRTVGERDGKAGKGSIRIETEPPGASVTFNSIPIPRTTPLTLSDQPTGTHSLSIAKDGYRTIDTSVVVEKDKTITKRFVLQRVFAGLKVISNPGGAKVVLDGDEVGTTPIDRGDLAPGEGTLVVSLKGYETVTRKVRLVADQVKEENIDLFAQTGSVTITCEPTGAEIFLDGALVGTSTGTPLTREKLALGSHSVRAAREGYEEANLSFTVEYNKTAPVSIALKGKPGAIYVMTTPEGADISLDDRPTGRKTGAKIENVSAGQHKISLSLTGYSSVVKNIIVRPGKTETVTETMSATPVIATPAPGGGKQSRIQGPLTGMEFVLIPAGSFMMGSPANEQDRESDEGPQHRVTLKPFYIMTTEVTQKMWTEVMGSNPSYWKGDNLPVEMVSWNDCQEFIKDLNQRDPGKGYRLPTEAEWEYACRAGTTTPFNTGNTLSADQANYDGNYPYGGGSKGVYREKTTSVGSFSPNAWGLYDMHGNVWEWCEDWYHNSYNGAPADGSAWTSGGGTSRVLRGGSWYGSARHCRSANRGYDTPDDGNNDNGFRVVRSGS